MSASPFSPHTNQPMLSALPPASPLPFRSPHTIAIPPISNTNTSLIISELPELAVAPLPPITDDDLRKKVFTHVSHIGAPTTRVSFLENGIVAGDYEKLEHVGDAILRRSENSHKFAHEFLEGRCVLTLPSEPSVTRLLHDMYPHMNHGSATVGPTFCAQSAPR